MYCLTVVCIDCFFGGFDFGRDAVVAAVGEEFSECWMFD